MLLHFLKLATTIKKQIKDRRWPPTPYPRSPIKAWRHHTNLLKIVILLMSYCLSLISWTSVTDEARFQISEPLQEWYSSLCRSDQNFLRLPTWHNLGLTYTKKNLKEFLIDNKIYARHGLFFQLYLRTINLTTIPDFTAEIVIYWSFCVNNTNNSAQ